MTRKPKSRDGLGVLGVGVVACVACCAGPLLAFFGGLSLVGLASTLFVAAGGLLVAAVAAVAFIVARRRRPVACEPSPDVVPVSAPTRKVSP